MPPFTYKTSAGVDLSIEEMLKINVARQDPTHVAWNAAKKKASKDVNVKIFKDDLGKAWDALVDLSNKGRAQKKKAPKAPLHPKVVIELKKRHKKVTDIASNYLVAIDAEIKKLGNAMTAAQKKAWGELQNQLRPLDSAADNLIRGLV